MKRTFASRTFANRSSAVATLAGDGPETAVIVTGCFVAGAVYQGGVVIGATYQGGPIQLQAGCC